MPGFRSHYFFGKKIYDELGGAKKGSRLPDAIKLHPRVYCLGQQGPDIFFYTPSAHMFYKKNIGIRMHSENIGRMFEGLLLAKSSDEALRSGTDGDIADAYILGFFGHYTLDTFCHPYISHRQEKMKYAGRFSESFGVHVLLETDIDNDNVHHFLGIEPSRFNHYDTIRVTKEEREVVARLLQQAIDFAFPDQGQKKRHIKRAISFSRTLFHMLNDKSGRKKSLVEALDKLLFGHLFLSPIILNDDKKSFEDPCNLSHNEWSNPWDQSIKSDKDFYMLMDEAAGAYKDRITMYERWRQDYLEDDKIKLLDMLGDNSYDSGLPWEETLRISRESGI